MLFPFLPIVKLLVSKVPAKSINDTWSPTNGDAGRFAV
jgi:hypothetical protein